MLDSKAIEAEINRDDGERNRLSAKISGVTREIKKFETVKQTGEAHVHQLKNDLTNQEKLLVANQRSYDKARAELAEYEKRRDEFGMKLAGLHRQMDTIRQELNNKK